MLHSRDGVRWVMRCVGIVPNNSILVSSHHKTFCLMASESPEWFYAYLKRDTKWAFLTNGFLLSTLPYRPDLWSAWDIVITCSQWPVFAIKTCNSFKVAIGLLVTSLISLLLAWSSSMEEQPLSRQGLGGTIHLSLLNDYLDCPPKDIQGLWNIFIPIPWSVAFHNFITGVFWKLLGVHGWVFAVKSTT